MSRTDINTCKLKVLDAEFNADCKKRAAAANIGVAARKSKRGGHAKVYHSSPRARPRGHGVVRSRAGRSAGQGHGTRPLRRSKRRYALEHRHEVSQRSMALARDLAHESRADPQSSPDLPGRRAGARSQRLASPVAASPSRNWGGETLRSSTSTSPGEIW